MKKWMLLLVGLVFLSGCKTTSMKGAPLLSGECEQREGPAAERLNLWPIVYYRDPALTVLWPLMEFRPGHQVVRPLYSAHGTDTDHPVYNVLWPIGRFDPAREDYRIFPVFWGDNYLCVAPLYYHSGHPVSGTGLDALFPLWIWNNRERGNSLHLMWPFFAYHDYEDWSSWRLWPVYSRRQAEESVSQYIAWPLIHTYKEPELSGSWVLPVYSYIRESDRKTFLSLPYSFSRSSVPDGKNWDMVLPIGYRSRQGDRSAWAAFPALSWGTGNGEWSDSYYLLGLGRIWQCDDELKHRLFPVYSYSSDAESQSCYTLPWWWKARTDGSGFNALFPIYYYGYGDNESAFYSLPWWMRNRADGSGFSAVAPLYFRSWSDDASAFLSPVWQSKTYADGSGWHSTFPLYYRGHSDDASSFYSPVWFAKKEADGSGWHTTIPLYYHAYSTNSSAFYSPMWMSEKNPDGSEWKASFPFYYSAASQNGSVMVTPFYARKLHADGSPAWRCYIPIVYVNEDYDSHFITPLGGRWRMDDEQHWIALPLLSGGSKNMESGRNIYLGGLAGQHWDSEKHSSYILPLYYRSPEEGTFVSLPYSTWTDGERQNHLIPPLLSGWQQDGESTRAALAGGVAGFKTGGTNTYSYVAPFYYASDKSVVSLPYASWSDGRRRTRVIPPLLSGWQKDDESTRALLAAGLAGWRTGGDAPYHYLLPFYYRAPKQDRFYSIPYSCWSDGDSESHLMLPLLSGWSVSPEFTDLFLMAGIAHWRFGVDGVEGSHLLPFYAWAKDEYFYTPIFGENRKKSYYCTPLVGRYENGSGKAGSWAFPLYHHKRSLGDDSVRGSYLLLGEYGKNDRRDYHSFYGVYDYSHWKSRRTYAEDSGSLYWGSGFSSYLRQDLIDRESIIPDSGEIEVEEESTRFDYLLEFGEVNEEWTTGFDPENKEEPLVELHSKDNALFPFWNYELSENITAGESLETFSLLGFLYDRRHEQGDEEAPDHDYLRRRILWRLYHYEKLNGDMSTDIFPGITVDSYEDGYYKMSVLWRLFRYEKDPESGKKKLDLLFIPFRR